MSSVAQLFPRRDDAGAIIHHRWEVDLDAAGSLARGWSERLGQEAVDMSEHLPRWVLTVARRGSHAACRCGGPLVFERGLRCAACGAVRRRPKDIQLAWYGLLPPIGVDGLPRIKVALEKRCPRRHVAGHHPELGTYLLVPALAVYPQNFPESPPRVYYLPELFSLSPMPAAQAAHAYHLLNGGEMCLFAGGQWRPEMSCREVLQQRAYPHVIKLLNYADGKRDAFAIVS